MSSQIAAIVILSNVVLSLSVLARTVRRSERSLYRYRLWRIRDELVDAAFSANKTPSKAYLDYIERLELSIEAESVTPYRLWSAWRILIRAGWQPNVDDSIARARPDERARLGTASAQVSRARFRALLLSSPSGWCLLPVVGVLAIAAKLRPSLFRTSSSPTPDVGVPEPVQTIAMWTRSQLPPPAEIIRMVFRANRRTDDMHRDDGHAYV